MVRQTLVIALTAAILSSCSTVNVKSAFDPSAAAFIMNKGKAVVTGQAFLRRNDGIVVYAAGSEVTLIPRTPYSDARIEAIFKGSHLAPADPITGAQVVVKNEDPTFMQYVRKVVANGEGRFAFPDVPDGTYYITTPVIWMIQAPQGGTVLQTVTVTGGQNVDTVLNGQ